jgi:hypothetical protein
MRPAMEIHESPSRVSRISLSPVISSSAYVAHDCHRRDHLVLESPALDDVILLLVDLLDQNRQSSLENNNKQSSNCGNFHRISLTSALFSDFASAFCELNPPPTRRNKKAHEKRETLTGRHENSCRNFRKNVKSKLAGKHKQRFSSLFTSSRSILLTAVVHLCLLA